MVLPREQILGAIRATLEEGGFRYATDIDNDLIHGVLEEPLRVYEGEYSIVAVAFYAGWNSLIARWPDAQSLFVEMITKKFSRADAKVWEGYLVLVTPEAPLEREYSVDRIRRDTTRVRKLVVTGGRDISHHRECQDRATPAPPSRSGQTSVVQTTGLLIAYRECWPAWEFRCLFGSDVVAAFEENRSPMEAVWRWHLR